MPGVQKVIALPDGAKVSVTLDPSKTSDDAMQDILASPQVQDALEKVAEQAYPMLHYRHGNDVLEARNSGEVVEAFLSSGEMSRAEGVISGWVDEDAYYNGLVDDHFATDEEEEGWGLFLASAAEALSEATGKEVEADSLRDAFESAVNEALRDADETSPLDELKVALNISVNFVAGAESGLDIDDRGIRAAIHREVHSTDVRADAPMANFLRLVNISPADFRKAVLNEHGVDLHDLQAPEGSPEYKQELARAASAEWRAFEVETDPSRPPLVTLEQAVEILDNATYGGVPFIYASLNPREFMSLPWKDGAEGKMAVELAPDGREGKVGIGIHNFLSGAGHYVRINQAVTLPLNHRNWHVDGTRYSYGVSSSNDLYNPAFRVSLRAVEVEPEVEPDLEASAPSM